MKNTKTIKTASNSTPSTRSFEGLAKLEFLDYGRLLRKMLRFWWVFAICTAITMTAAYFYNKTIVPIYTAGIDILMREQARGGSYELINGFSLSQDQTNLTNQRHIYTSSKMIARAIKGRNFEVSYYNIGRFCDLEMFGTEVPFRVEFDTLHSQPLGVVFDVTYLAENEVSMHVTGGFAQGYDYQTSKNTSYGAGNVDVTYNVRLGEKIENDMFSFTILPNNGPLTAGRLSGTIRFYFNSTQSIIGMWRGSLGFNPIGDGGTVIRLTVVGTNMQKMVSFLYGLNDASVEYNLSQKNEAATRTLQFLKMQLSQTSDSLAAVSDKLKRFKKENNFLGRNEYTNSIDKRYSVLDEELQTLLMKRKELVTVQEKLESGNLAIEEYFPMVALSDNGLIQRQLTELFSIHQTLSDLKSESDSNPYKKSVLRQKQFLTDNINVLVGQAIDLCDKQADDLRQQMVAIIAESSKLPELQMQLQNIEREYSIQDAVYTFLLQKQSETQIAKASNAADNDVLQEATGLGMVGPDTRKNTTTALALGLMLPAAVFFLIEFMNTKVRSLKELKKILPGIPVIGVIPQNNTCGDMPCLTQPQSAISESFRGVRAKMRFVATENKHKLVAISSCNAGEGKTFCAINIAINAALAGKKCLLMNYDLRRPRAEKALGLTGKKGITDYLIGSCTEISEAIVHSEVNGFDIMPAGSIPPNPSELIACERNSQLIEEVRELYDMVIFDTAPIGCVADCRMLEQVADIFIMVVKSHKSEFGHLYETVESIKYDGAKSLCLLFNGAAHTRREYSRYGSYYSYYLSYNAYSSETPESK